MRSPDSNLKEESIRVHESRTRPLALATVLTLAIAGCTPRLVDQDIETDAFAESFAAWEEVVPYSPFAERLASHRTRLLVSGPSQGSALESPPPGSREVSYQSAGLTLRGWYAVPSSAHSSGRRPAVVYLHNDFALYSESFYNAKPFLDAGYVLMLPSLRGENGNPGDFELLLGEVDDVKAAVRWVQQQPEVDPNFVYVIGHSIGGGLASLLSLHGDVDVRATASVGGTYRTATFHYWKRRYRDDRLIRFDLADKSETTLRLLVPNLRDLRHPHIAYAGLGDPFDTSYARYMAALAARHGVALTYVPVSGDHMGSVREAVGKFNEFIGNDLARSQATN